MITVICVGKIKEPALKQLLAEYQKRILPYHQIKIIEVKDFPNYENEALNNQSLSKEASLIKKHLRATDYKILLDLKGKSYSSKELASKIEQLFAVGKSKITFIIGGSLGVSSDIKQEVDELIKLSDLTLPHGLARLFFLEQIYRSFKIINQEPYHK